MFMFDTPRVALLRRQYGDHYPGTHRFVTERETADPYLELLRLLSEAAGIEHSLMLAYCNVLDQGPVPQGPG
jgi:hypothetical protein